MYNIAISPEHPAPINLLEMRMLLHSYIQHIYPAGKAVFRHCGIELEGVPLVSVPLCDETRMHA